jgi:class 3 adenylate cyclase/tetratricopeptide (TPR) repeat protein
VAVSRRTVTVLFADVVDSTPLGERLDPEALRRVMTRWSDRAHTTITHHGGVVEKFIGDAVMGVFGIPGAHEDDAPRAVRAAAELREELSRLNEEFERDFGVHVSMRVGVNTGEVVAGDPSSGHSFVSGDAVNSAKRLEEAARAAEILIGEQTERLVRSIALLEPAEDVTAKGKTAPLRAWRLLATVSGLPAIARRADTPLVGRRDELGRLRAAYDRAVESETCSLFTLLGAAGIGKSRLAAEFFADVGGDAAVLVGRCLPYGEGITFWPLTEILREVGSDEALATLLGDEAEVVAERLRAVTGNPSSVGTQETFWAIRKVFEALAHSRPLVVCFEDIHWAEPTLLDLIEYLAGWARDAPIVLLCLARPEFLSERPAWLSGQEHSASLTLQPLSRDDSERLLDALGTADDDRTRIAQVAEGNPLFVEQLAAMLAEDGSLDAIPPTIQALLAARLDRLTADERSMIERASVCGKEFWRDAVIELTPENERAAIGSALMSLVRKDLIRPHRATGRADDAFRFSHALVRDAAYAGIPKEARATLHETFARWLDDVVGATTDVSEIIGYHLEQAFRYRAELGTVDDATRAIAARAVDLLGAAGRRALARSDIPAAVNLLERSIALARSASTEERPQLLLDLGTAFRHAGDLARADALLSAATDEAEARSDVAQSERARIEQAALRLYVESDVDHDEVRTLARAAISTFKQSGDELGLARAWRLLADVDWAELRLTEMQASLEQALAHARRAGDQREASEIMRGLCRVALLGPMPVDEAIRRCRATIERERDDLGLQATVQEVMSVLVAAKGRFAEAHELLERARRSYHELGLELRTATMYAAFVELLADDAAAAEVELRRACEALQAIGEHGELSTTAALLALVLCRLDRFDEAERFAQVAEESSSPGDTATDVIIRRARAKILAAQGEVSGAAELARTAVRLAERTDWLQLRADALLDLAELQQALGKAPAAERSVQEAIALYDAKGIDVAADRARLEFSELVGA